jgi:hypothetical protein
METEPVKHTYKKDIRYLTDHLNWPSVLTKAIIDEWMYMVKLKTGEMYAFERAHYVNDEFVRIDVSYLDEPYTEHGLEQPKIFFDRGMEIRVSDIVWVADCGYSHEECAKNLRESEARLKVKK